ncbi:MAG: hypothetical protein EOO22_02350 [Comamonadaceae bacterium]|nr:MAG: hypothetical protein EOO22_02350 [Comamonadaceae bacterium]
MKTHNPFRLRAAAVVLASAFLIACGGGNDGAISGVSGELALAAPAPPPESTATLVYLSGEDIVYFAASKSRRKLEEAGVPVLSLRCFEELAKPEEPLPDGVVALPPPTLVAYVFTVESKHLETGRALGFGTRFDAGQFEPTPFPCDRKPSAARREGPSARPASSTMAPAS